MCGRRRRAWRGALECCVMSLYREASRMRRPSTSAGCLHRLSQVVGQQPSPSRRPRQRFHRRSRRGHRGHGRRRWHPAQSPARWRLPGRLGSGDRLAASCCRGRSSSRSPTRKRGSSAAHARPTTGELVYIVGRIASGSSGARREGRSPASPGRGLQRPPRSVVRRATGLASSSSSNNLITPRRAAATAPPGATVLGGLQRRAKRQRGGAGIEPTKRRATTPCRF